MEQGLASFDQRNHSKLIGSFFQGSSCQLCFPVLLHKGRRGRRSFENVNSDSRVPNLPYLTPNPFCLLGTVGDNKIDAETLNTSTHRSAAISQKHPNILQSRVAAIMQFRSRENWSPIHSLVGRRVAPSNFVLRATSDA